ncbi:MAG TPA: aminodeoxychorismate synthase component I [Saprospiraceae bacterium]|nr:aminodeoxychorismate synthase component I [Saprospiraceae bacterium]
MTQKQIPEVIATAIDTMNTWGRERHPFLFVIDYAMRNPLFFPLDQVPAHSVLFDINGLTNSTSSISSKHGEINFIKLPVPLAQYRAAFDTVMAELAYGNSYLLNLTFSTPIQLNLTLRQVFDMSRAKYKLYIKDRFVVFSPETFVRIKKGRVSAYPMKGTIDASLLNAREQILQNAKETAEHITIVDLIRNDLSRVAQDVRVDRFRYIDEVKTNQKTLLQVSSEISGKLPTDYHHRLGDILYSLLPAGSISGAPKVKTVEILQHAETHERGYFTGICGYFDGIDLESGVMIRFIEKQGDELIYKSGGGITTQSNMEEEYQEMIDKVYLAVG